MLSVSVEEGDEEATLVNCLRWKSFTKKWKSKSTRKVKHRGMVVERGRQTV